MQDLVNSQPKVITSQVQEARRNLQVSCPSQVASNLVMFLQELRSSKQDKLGTEDELVDVYRMQGRIQELNELIFELRKCIK